MKTPFFGSFDILRSRNLADCACTNLYPSIVETRDAKEIGAFYMTPGFDFLTTIGNGPIRGEINFLGLLYAVSGGQVYSVDTNFVGTLIGTIGTSSGPVSMIQNGTQMVFFDGIKGYLLPGGLPLTGGTIGAAGTNYAVGDTIVLQNTNGTQTASAVLTVLTLSGSAVATFSVTQTGAFKSGSTPTGFTQQSTSAIGSGFTLTAPTYGANVPIYTLTLPAAGPMVAVFQDGFGLVNSSGTNHVYQSNLYDLSIWLPLNFTSIDSDSEPVNSMIDLHREVYFIKTNKTEVWANAGLGGFAFQRLQGVYMQYGTTAPFSVTTVSETIIWLAQNEQGQGIVIQSQGYEPKKISTKAIENQIASYPVISDAIGYSYEQRGNIFYVLTFPTGNATWVYDLGASALAGVPMWHQRASWNPISGTFNRHQGNCHTFFNQKNVIGDYSNGNLYALNMDALTDAGAEKKWLRSWRALPKPVFDPVTFSQLQIDMETGIKVPDGTSPEVMLRWSDDGGHNWSNQVFAQAGPPGATAQRVIFRRLGSTRRNSGLDRIFELSSVDQTKVALLGAELT